MSGSERVESALSSVDRRTDDGGAPREQCAAREETPRVGADRAEPLVLEYAPWWRVAAYAVTGLAALLVAVAGFALGWGDGDAKLILLVIGLGALDLAVRDALLRPTLWADADGVEVIDGVAARRAQWAEVRAVRPAVVNRRMLVHLRTLELDLGDRLVVLSRCQLAHNPVDAAERLEELCLR